MNEKIIPTPATGGAYDFDPVTGALTQSEEPTKPAKWPSEKSNTETANEKSTARSRSGRATGIQE